MAKTVADFMTLSAQFHESMLTGDPAAESAIAGTARELVGAILPGKGDD